MQNLKKYREKKKLEDAARKIDFEDLKRENKELQLMVDKQEFKLSEMITKVTKMQTESGIVLTPEQIKIYERVKSDLIDGNLST